MVVAVGLIILLAPVATCSDTVATCSDTVATWFKLNRKLIVIGKVDLRGLLNRYGTRINFIEKNTVMKFFQNSFIILNLYKFN